MAKMFTALYIIDNLRLSYVVAMCQIAIAMQLYVAGDDAYRFIW